MSRLLVALVDRRLANFLLSMSPANDGPAVLPLCKLSLGTRLSVPTPVSVVSGIGGGGPATAGAAPELALAATTDNLFSIVVESTKLIVSNENSTDTTIYPQTIRKLFLYESRK